MQISEPMAGEGASTPHFDLADVPSTSVVFCPMAGSAVGLTAEMVEQIYRLALELALRALRPSLYDQARHICEN